MRLSFFRFKVKYHWAFIFGLLLACVERIDFEVPPANFQIILEGMITNNPGPYTVSLSESNNVNVDSVVRNPVTGAKLTLFDDLGNTEDFKETSPGIYTTAGIMQGQVGHSYYIRITTADGKIFESEPDELNPVGEVEEIRFEFEKRTKLEAYGEVDASVFNIFVDADAGTAFDNYVRWRFTGTYKVETNPKDHYISTPPYAPYKSPFPCSGYILTGGPGGGLLVQVGDCECCICWVKQFEVAPQLSDTQLISGSKFSNVKVGEVSVNSTTFYDQYMVEVEQMSLTKQAFDFFKLIRNQKEQASSIFQPPFGEIKGNIKAINTSDAITGIFYATAITKKSIFIKRSDVPYLVTPIREITYPCNEYFRNASTTKPEGWE